MDQYVGRPLSKKIYPEWRGGYYYAAKPKADPNAPLGLLYVSRWSTPDAAAQFAGIYAKSLKQRYKKADEIGNGDASQTDGSGESQTPTLKGRHAWNTDEGTIVVEEQGDMVFVSESLDAGTTETLEREVFAK
jgi:hypothetical protein